MSHWCHDIHRDEAVRAAEDGRDCPLPTLEEAIAAASPLPCRVEGTHWADWERLRAERDTAIRERDKLRSERITQALTADRFAAAVREADRLKARVAELEGALESVADRAAAAETALKSAPAASELPPPAAFIDALQDPIAPTSGERIRAKKLSPAASDDGALNPHAWGVLLDLHYAASDFRDSSIHDHQVRLEKALAAAERLLTQPRPAAPAASGAAVCENAHGSSTEEREMSGEIRRVVPFSGGEPGSTPGHAIQPASGAAGAMPVSSEVLAWGVMVDGKIDRTSFAEAIFLDKATAESWCRIDSLQGKGTVVPLYAAPQAAKGWLTPTEREAIMYLIANRSQFAPQTPHEERRNAACQVCHSLLARSSPPEVVLPPMVITWTCSKKPSPPLA